MNLAGFSKVPPASAGSETAVTDGIRAAMDVSDVTNATDDSPSVGGTPDKDGPGSPQRELAFVALQTSNDSHCQRLFTALSAAGSGRYECFRDVLEYQQVHRVYPDLLLLVGVRGTETNFLDVVQRTLLGIYVVRIFLCQHRVDKFEEFVSTFDNIQPGTVIRCQCYPRSLEARMGDDVPMHIDLRMSGFSAVAYAVCVPSHVFMTLESNEPYRKRVEYEKDGKKIVGADIASLAVKDAVCYLYGISSAALLYRPRTQARSEKNIDRISRASHKLAEVFDSLGYPAIDAIPSLDIGSSPGGWTKLLAERTVRCVSVDPGQLDPTVTALQNVEYLQAKAEDVFDYIRAQGPYGVICCDANDTDACRLVLPVLDLLAPGGLLVLTIKAPNKFVNREQVQKVCGPLEAAACKHWDETFDSMTVYWLLANTDRERVLVARRKK